MNDVPAGSRDDKLSESSPWYRKDPTLAWAIVVGLVAAWIYVAPIAFNQGALEALFRESYLTGMVALTPYPQLYDDRVALYASAVTTLVVGFAAGLPLVLRRVLTWWTVIVLLLTLLLGLLLIFVWVPRYSWLWLVLAGVAMIGGACAAAELRGFGQVAKPAGWVFRSQAARLILALSAVIEVFLIIPAASGAYAATRPPDMRDQRVYLLLHMKDPASPLHEEIVELVASTTEYFVVRLSEKVPHPRQEMGPTTLPVEAEPGSFSVGPVYFPMLVQRESVDIVTPSLDPDFLIAEMRRMLSHFTLTTQPAFKVGRQGPGVRVWTEYPTPSSSPATQAAGAP